MQLLHAERKKGDYGEEMINSIPKWIVYSVASTTQTRRLVKDERGTTILI